MRLKLRIEGWRKREDGDKKRKKKEKKGFGDWMDMSGVGVRD